MIYDVKNEFARTNSPFPVQAEELIRERFEYRREFAEMQAREDEQKQIAEFIGSGEVMQSISDQIVEDLNKPEIMGINVEDFRTTKEVVVPPEITKFYSKGTFFGRIASRFKRLFRR